MLWLSPRLAALLIAAITVTLRYEVIAEEGAVVPTPPAGGIYCFWHQCTFLAAWYFRRFRPTVLVSRSFDGELIARTLELFGYGTVRGSSTRGGASSLRQLRAVVEGGTMAVFTADGPRGPIYQAKPGPVLLAQLTGMPMGSFHLQPEHAWVLRSWDRFLIPRPFSKVVVCFSRLVPAPGAGATAGELDASLRQVNGALERARLKATAHLRTPG